MPIPLPIPDLPAWLSRIPQGPLGAPGVGPEIARGETSRDLSLDPASAAGLGTAGAAGAEVALFAFNSRDDADADGVLGPAAAPGGPQPAVEWAPDRAWIKLHLQVHAHGEARAGGGALEASAGARLRLSDYRVFRPEQDTRLAAAAAVAGARLATRLDDVLDLAPGEALCLRVDGGLSTRVEVRWADVFAGGVSALRRWAPEGGVLPVRVAAAATLSARVHLRDELMLVLTREAAGGFRVSLRRVRAGSGEAGGGMGVEVELEDPAAAEAAAEAVADSLSVPAPLAGRADGLRQELRAAVSTLARGRVEAGFRFAYRRMERDASVLGATLDAAALRRFHGDLVRARLEPLLEAARRGEPGVEVEWYLGERTRGRGWTRGFSLAFGGWSAGGADSEQVRQVEQRDAAGRRRIAFHGRRGYAGSWGGSAFEWAGELSAGVDAWSAGPEPRASELQRTVELLWRGAVRRLDERSLREQMDTAMVWEVLPPHALPRIAERVREWIGRPVEFVTRLRVDDAALRALLVAPALSDPRVWAGPLGAAMPWLPEEPGREDVVVRRSLYGPLWAAWLADPRLRPADLGRAAEEHLGRRMGQPALARRERRWEASRAVTLAGLAELNPGTAAAAEEARLGLAALRDALAAGRPEQSGSAAAYRALAAVWARSLHVRAAGALLLDLARAGGAEEEVERTLTISTPEEALVLGA